MKEELEEQFELMWEEEIYQDHQHCSDDFSKKYYETAIRDRFKEYISNLLLQERYRIEEQMVKAGLQINKEAAMAERSRIKKELEEKLSDDKYYDKDDILKIIG